MSRLLSILNKRLKCILLLLFIASVSCTEDSQEITERVDFGHLENPDGGELDLEQDARLMSEVDLDRGIAEDIDPSDFDIESDMMGEEEVDFSNGSSQSPSLALGEMHADQSLQAHPHRFDVYLPNTQPHRVIVFLHGGLGKKESIAEKLGLRSENQIHQDEINALGVAWVIPQGQAIQGNGLMVPTWSNRVMSSGVDDVLFLRDLSTWIGTHWNEVPLVLSGHSNGGMMTHRIWCEAPELFSLYVAVSGPPSTSYDLAYEGSTPIECLGGPPYWAMIGSEDRTIGVNDQAYWTLTTSNSDTYERLQDQVINEQRAHEFIRVPKVCGLTRRGEERALPGITQWSACRGRVLLWWVNQPEPNRLEAINPTYGHKIDSLESAGDFILREKLAEWTP